MVNFMLISLTDGHLKILSQKITRRKCVHVWTIGKSESDISYEIRNLYVKRDNTKIIPTEKDVNYGCP